MEWNGICISQSPIQNIMWCTWCWSEDKNGKLYLSVSVWLEEPWIRGGTIRSEGFAIGEHIQHRFPNTKRGEEAARRHNTVRDGTATDAWKIIIKNYVRRNVCRYEKHKIRCVKWLGVAACGCEGWGRWLMLIAHIIHADDDDGRDGSNGGVSLPHMCIFNES